MTPRDRDVLLALAAGIDRDGVSPTVRELETRIGTASRSMVAGALDRLEDDGFITRRPGRQRNLRLTDTGRTFVTNLQVAKGCAGIAKAVENLRKVTQEIKRDYSG